MGSFTSRFEQKIDSGDRDGVSGLKYPCLSSNISNTLARHSISLGVILVHKSGENPVRLKNPAWHKFCQINANFD